MSASDITFVWKYLKNILYSNTRVLPSTHCVIYDRVYEYTCPRSFFLYISIRNIDNFPYPSIISVDSEIMEGFIRCIQNQEAFQHNSKRTGVSLHIKGLQNGYSASRQPRPRHIQFVMKKEKKRVAAEFQIHSDLSFQYAPTAYFTQFCGITPSMSSKGTPYDNTMKKLLLYPQNRVYLPANPKDFLRSQ